MTWPAGWPILLGLLFGGTACINIQGRDAIAVAMVEFSFEPNQAQIRGVVGRNATLVLQNTGLIEHNLALPDLGVQSPDVPPGRTVRFTFPVTRPGTYRFLCTKPGHEQRGMVGTLTLE